MVLACRVYLSKPYLVDGYKFDIRVYTLITSCDPLRIFVYNEGLVSKISTLNKILLSQGVDLDRLWHAIDQVIVKTIISAWPILKHSYHACFPSHDMVLLYFSYR
ncbi:hypothetical protein B5X24_HaOG202448 [Helicoverpa armigera]|nr:hypothetical protein B5X24_HaOG202448 [Helicoverpa armigera]